MDDGIKGYRVPRSELTSELTPARLCFHNFEWIASSVSSLGLKNPVVRDRILWIPLLFDDFPLYSSKLSYREWERQALDDLEKNDFVAFSLHDCYAHLWLPHYRAFLARIRELGSFKTLDEVASEVVLAHGQ